MKQRFMKTGAAVVLIACSFTATAQDAGDALRFSNTSVQGTARSIGFGNTLGSVGGDFSSLSVNPAGIGIYRKSEIMITPSLMFGNTDATYLGNKEKDKGQHFSIGNFGMVFTQAAKGRHYDNSNWKSFSFGIGMNRVADFTRNYSYSGTNTTSSGSFVFEADANNYPNDLEHGNSPGYLGYQSYLLDTGTLNGQPGYISVVNPTADAPVRQLTNVRERGGMSEFLVSLGGNYQEKLLLGATIGIPYLHYTREKTYREEDMSGNTNNDFANFNYNENLRTNGVGINAKLGFIYKPTDNFRIGGAVHTPSWISLHDQVDYNLTANTEQFAGTNSATAGSTYDYNLSTPWKAVASATALFGPHGFFTVDYEYVDYSSSRFRFDDADRITEDVRNKEIRQSFRGASNIRAGIEVRLDMISLRGGFGYYGNPYQSSVYKDGERYDFSGGIGFRMKSSFIDIGIIHHQYKNEEQPYTLPDDATYLGLAAPTASLKNNQTNAVVTFGWKF